jgi:HEAT repeat protein
MTPKQRKWALLLFGLVAMSALASSLPPEGEPCYEGKPLSHWVAQLGQESPPGPDETFAEERVRQIGTNAIPYLLEWMDYEPPAKKVGGKAESIIEQNSPWVSARVPDSRWMWQVADVAQRRAYRAATAFAVLGTNAEAAIPDLKQMLRDLTKPYTCTVALYSLAAISTNRVPEIAVWVARADPGQQRLAAAVISDLLAVNTDPQRLVPLLVEFLNSPDAIARIHAADCLGDLAKHDTSQAALVVPALTKCLREAPLVAVVLSTVQALGKYGDKAVSAVPALLKETQAPYDADIRIAATNALKRVAPEALTNAPPTHVRFYLTPQ